MGVGQGESGKEADRHAAVLALAASVTDPVVIVVMRLLPPPAVASDGIGQTRWTAAQKLPARTGGPVEARLAIIRRTWDKRSRSTQGSLT